MPHSHIQHHHTWPKQAITSAKKIQKNNEHLEELLKNGRVQKFFSGNIPSLGTDLVANVVLLPMRPYPS